jgi:ABC-type dipeptide/oligopeptide/nickel transport system permease component
MGAHGDAACDENAAPPVLTLMNLVWLSPGGSVLVETVFSWLGQVFS